MSFKKVMIAGSGVLGSQIAFQAAYHGFEVIVYDISDTILEQAKERLNALQLTYQEEVNATKEATSAAFSRLHYESDLKTASSDVDLIIEAIPEVIKIKEEFYQEIGQYADERTVFASNSSSFIPSQFAEITGRPEKFIALHFANRIWRYNIAEVMGHANTDPKVFNQLVEFAKQIGMVPIPIHKEQPQYIFNTLLAPYLLSAISLLAKGVSEPKVIDDAWTIGTGAPQGPFEWLDMIGITTTYNILVEKVKETKAPELEQIATFLKENYIDKGKLGLSTGEGFYKY